MIAIYNDIYEEASSKHGMDMKVFQFRMSYLFVEVRHICFAMQYHSTMSQTHETDELNQPRAGRNDHIV